jgi:tripartite-type tricarboxylate transporter receptor subunit TctC
VIRDNKLRALAVSSTTPLPLLPEVPPFAKVSGAADFEAVSWHTLLVPSKTPKEVVDRLHAEMKEIMSDPEMIKRAADIGLIPIETPSVAGINDYIKSERVKWGALVDRIGLRGSQ